VAGIIVRPYSLVCGSQLGDDEDSPVTTLWLALLQSVIKPLRKLRGGRGGNRPHRAAPRGADTAPSVNALDLTTGALCLTLEAHIRVVVRAMTASGVDTPVVLTKLIADQRGEELGEFRVVLAGLLASVTQEVVGPER